MFLLSIALAPSIAIMLIIYFADKYEKEPISVLTKMFFLGVLTCIPASVFEMIFYVDVENEKASLIVKFIFAFFVVGVAEEGFKWLSLRLGIWRNKHFSEIFDGIVYSVFVSLGFATLENVLYVLGGATSGGAVGGIITGIMRALTAVPMHAILGIIMGYYFGYAKYHDSTNNIPKRNLNLILSVVTPIMLHGLYDFLLFTRYRIAALIYLVLLICMYITGIVKVIKLRNLK